MKSTHRSLKLSGRSKKQPDAMVENQQPEKNNNTVIIDNPNANNVYDQARVKQRAFERMNPAAPHEVLNTEAPHQVGDFPSRNAP